MKTSQEIRKEKKVGVILDVRDEEFPKNILQNYI